jgi:hypothetical protein
MTNPRNVKTLYRPVGLAELEKILDTGSSRFPSRLPEQPIFYPVLTRVYAEQIAERWNAPAAPRFAGFVTDFQVEALYVSRFEPHIVGSSMHAELWVPAEQLDEFNDHIVGRIALVGAFYGERYAGPEPQTGTLMGTTARDQPALLARMLASNAAEFAEEIKTQERVVLLNFAYWVRTDLSVSGLTLPEKRAVLEAIRRVWMDAFPEDSLVGSDELGALTDSTPSV